MANPAQITPAESAAAPFDYKSILQQMVHKGASDLHLKVGRPPTLRVNGEVRELAAGGIAWERAVQWLPTFTATVGQLVVRGTVFAPYRLELMTNPYPKSILCWNVSSKSPARWRVVNSSIVSGVTN